MSFSHTLIRLQRDEKVTLCPSATRNGPQMNFGEAASIPLTMAQAEEVARELQAWIDARCPPPPANADGLTPPDAA